MHLIYLLHLMECIRESRRPPGRLKGVSGGGAPSENKIRPKPTVQYDGSTRCLMVYTFRTFCVHVATSSFNLHPIIVNVSLMFRTHFVQSLKIYMIFTLFVGFEAPQLPLRGNQLSEIKLCEQVSLFRASIVVPSGNPCSVKSLLPRLRSCLFGGIQVRNMMFECMTYYLGNDDHTLAIISNVRIIIPGLCSKVLDIKVQVAVKLIFMGTSSVIEFVMN